jgi:hypothetical protein
MQPKECERALARTLKSLGPTMGKSATRALVRRLDARIATVTGAWLAGEFDVRDVDAYARSEGVSTRKGDDDGAGTLLARVRDALNISSFARLAALASAWDPSGDPWMDVALSTQPALFDWWATTSDERALVSIAASDEAFGAGSARVAAAVVKCVEQSSTMLSVYFTREAIAALDAAVEVMDRARPLTSADVAVFRAMAAQVGRSVGWGAYSDEMEAGGRAILVAMTLALGEAPADEFVLQSALSELEVTGDSWREDRLRVIRARCPCPELARWVAQCEKRPRG